MVFPLAGFVSGKLVGAVNMSSSSKRTKRKSGGGSPGPGTVSKEDFDAIQLSHAGLETQIHGLRAELAGLQQTTETLLGQRAVDAEVIEKLKKDNANLQEVNAQLLARLRQPPPAPTAPPQQQQQPSSAAAQHGPSGGLQSSAEQRIEQLLRAANACKVVVFPRGTATTADEVCTKLQTAASLPAYATSGAVQAGSVWIVSLVSRTFALQVLTRWYSFYQLTRWGVDQALTRAQLAERATLKPRFMELKAAGAFPRWHGSAIFVRMQHGVRPADQWNPQMALPPRPRGPPPATTPPGATTYAAAAAAASPSGPAPATAATAPVTRAAGARPTGARGTTAPATPRGDPGEASTSTARPGAPAPAAPEAPFPGPPDAPGGPPAQVPVPPAADAPMSG